MIARALAVGSQPLAPPQARPQLQISIAEISSLCRIEIGEETLTPRENDDRRIALIRFTSCRGGSRLRSADGL